METFTKLFGSLPILVYRIRKQIDYWTLILGNFG
jgi:hypothetical protein